MTLDSDGYYAYPETGSNLDNGWAVTASHEGNLTAIVCFVIAPLLITGAYALFSHVSHERRRDIMPIYSTGPCLSDEDLKELGLD